MRRFRDISIKWKLMLVIMLSSAIALLLACTAFVVYDLVTFRQGLTRDLATLADIIASNSTAAISFGTPGDAEETLSALQAKHDIVSACIYSLDGKVFAQYVRPDLVNALQPPPVQRNGTRLVHGYLTFFGPILLHGEKIGILSIQSADLAQVQRRLRRYVTIVTVVLLFSLLATLLLSTSLQRLVSRPILHLADVAGVVTRQKNYAIRAVKAGKDESGLLIDAFNGMLTQIQERDVALRKTNEELEGRVEDRTRELTLSQERLEINVSMLEATLEATTDGILVVDRVCRSTGFNQKLLDMWQIPTPAPDGQEPDILDLIGAKLKNREAFLARVRELCSQPDTESYDVVNTLSGRIIECYSQPQKTGSSYVGKVWSFRDVTERKRAEERLKAYAAELEQSNRELQDFAMIASHDLQEPLRKIQAFGDLLKEEYGDVLQSDGKEYLELMTDAAGRMQSLINALLTLSRVTTRAQPFVPVNLETVMQDVLQDLHMRVQETGGSVEIGHLDTIDADPTQIRQVLQNLVGNALKFHRKNEKPVIKVWSYIDRSTTFRSARGTLSNEFCWITVQDNGIGFDEKYLDRIFAPFQRLHSQQEYEGTGIGLAICRKIVERHCGAIQARSIPGEGSSFVVTLPIRQTEEETHDE